MDSFQNPAAMLPVEPLAEPAHALVDENGNPVFDEDADGPVQRLTSTGYTDDDDTVTEPLVQRFLSAFHRAIREQNKTEIQGVYEHGWNSITERFFDKSSWPSPLAVSNLIPDEDSIFLILYKELYFRHLHTKLQPTLDQRFESFENYCDLFNFLLNSPDGPVSLDLPVQWIWDIVDEFLFQFQVFCQYRSNLSNKADEEIEQLVESPQIWNVQTVLNILHSLVERSNIQEQLRVAREGGDMASVAGPFGQLPMYKMLGYFSLIGLLRLHCLLGDYYLALRSLDDVDMELNKKALFARVTACHINTFYYVAFAYLMQRRYRDAGVTLSNILSFLSRTKQYHTRSGQFEHRLEETVEATLKEKQGENMDKVLRSGEQQIFEEWFSFASPKFVAPIAPNYEAANGNNLSLEPFRYQLRLFLNEVKQQLVIPTIRSVMKLYTTMPVSKLSTFLSTKDDDECRSQLMCYKHKTRALRWQSGPLISGEFAYTGDMNFFLTKDRMFRSKRWAVWASPCTQDLIHISSIHPPQRYADFFVNQINGFVEVMTTLTLMPPPPPAPSVTADVASAAGGPAPEAGPRSGGGNHYDGPGGRSRPSGSQDRPRDRPNSGSRWPRPVNA